MTLHNPPARPLRSQRASPLKGAFRVPGDKAISLRALMLGSIARGETTIAGLLETEDVLRMATALRALGARIEKRRDAWHVQGLGAGGLLEPAMSLDFGPSSAGIELAVGLAGIYPFATRFIGAFPPGQLLEPLRLMGIEASEGNGEPASFTLRGPRTPVPLEYSMPVPSAETKDAVLFAALSIPGTTRLIEPARTSEDTENLMAAFGAAIVVSELPDDARAIEVAGLPDLKPQKLAIPGDPALAAFALVAAMIVPGSELLIENVLTHPNRMGLLMTLIEMGGDITLQDRRAVAGEDVADIRVRFSRLHPAHLPAEQSGVTIEDIPILAVAAAFAEGATVVPFADPSPPERERLETLAMGLQANGVDCELAADRLTVTGHGRVKGGAVVRTGRDHRLAMSFLVLGMGTRDPVTIDDDATIAAMFPGFVARFEERGVRFAREV